MTCSIGDPDGIIEAMRRDTTLLFITDGLNLERANLGSPQVP
jgi:hypothetical protein